MLLAVSSSPCAPLRSALVRYVVREPKLCHFRHIGPVQFYIIYHTILYYTILYYTILYYTILYYTILYYTILYYTILYYTILYYTILYYTIRYYIYTRHTIQHQGPARVLLGLESLLVSHPVCVHGLVEPSCHGPPSISSPTPGLLSRNLI